MDGSLRWLIILIFLQHVKFMLELLMELIELMNFLQVFHFDFLQMFKGGTKGGLFITVELVHMELQI